MNRQFEGTVYFILNPALDHVKIGFSKNPVKRLAALQTASSVSLEFLLILPGDKFMEKMFHDKFEHCRLRGEWFDYKDEELKIRVGILQKALEDMVR